MHVLGSKDELVLCSTSSEGNAASLLAGTDMNCVDYGALRQSLAEGLIKVIYADLHAHRYASYFNPFHLQPFAKVP